MPLLSAAVVAGGVVMVRQAARLAALERQHVEDVRALAGMRGATLQEPAAVEAAPAQPSAEARPVARSDGRGSAPVVSEGA
ncbi:MAG TPA: hypothetical protein VGS58_09490, partial [Candidatus Sulfopaludibacter sp.]|nr:hypothetical protein [Candidatus Sulfopaludibacter sp.]